jgi:hypothetical protein
MIYLYTCMNMISVTLAQECLRNLLLNQKHGVLAYDSSYQKVLLKLMAVEYGPRIIAMGKEPFALVCQLSTNDCIIA